MKQIFLNLTAAVLVLIGGAIGGLTATAVMHPSDVVAHSRERPVGANSMHPQRGAAWHDENGARVVAFTRVATAVTLITAAALEIDTTSSLAFDLASDDTADVTFSESGTDGVDIDSPATINLAPATSITIDASDDGTIDATITEFGTDGLRISPGAGGLALEIHNGADPGATCTVGQIFLDTNEATDTNCTTTADNSLCLCTATDTWTALENN